jgi:hypothetical protein
MRLPFAIRAALIALLLTGAGLAPAAYADNGSIRFNVVKAGFIVGGSGFAPAHWCFTAGAMRLGSVG